MLSFKCRDWRVHPRLWPPWTQPANLAVWYWYAYVYYRGVCKDSHSGKNVCVWSVGIMVAGCQNWQLLKFCKLYICLSSSCEIICSLFHGTCFTSENNVVCLMISLSISSSKRCFRHMYSLFTVCTFYSVNAICQVKIRKKWGQHMGPLCVFVCVCVRGRFLPFYFGELERRLSASLFPTNQVLPTCQPRRDARPFKTLC